MFLKLIASPRPPFHLYIILSGKLRLVSLADCKNEANLIFIKNVLTKSIIIIWS